jgi:uncharacterized membrane protein (DUF2068 family)
MSHNKPALFHSNRYNAESACHHCSGVGRHEHWCLTLKPVVYHVYEIVAYPSLKGGQPMKHLKSGQSSSYNPSAGLRAVAIFEAAKAVLILLLGFGVLTLIHKNLDDIAEQLTEALRVSPGGKLSRLFLNLANRSTDKTLWVLAIGALVDATVRSIEAFGLWRGREWAQYFALLAGTLYLPGELYSLLRHPSWIKWGVLVANAVVVVFMALCVKSTLRQDSQT